MDEETGFGACVEIYSAFLGSLCYRGGLEGYLVLGCCGETKTTFFFFTLIIAPVHACAPPIPASLLVLSGRNDLRERKGCEER